MHPNERTNGNDQTETPTKAPTKSKVKRWVKAFSIFLSFIVVLLVVIQLTVQYYSNEIVGSAFSRFVAYKSEGLYQLSYSDIQISLIRGKVNIADFELDLDSTRLETLLQGGKQFRYLYQVEIPSIELQLASIKKLVLNQSLGVESLSIVKPNVTLRSFKREEAVKNKVNDLFDVISGYLNDFTIAQFYVTEGELHVAHSVGTDILLDEYDVQNINLNIRNMAIDSTTRARSGKPFRLDDFKLSTAQVHISLPRNSYQLGMRAFEVSSVEKFLQVDSFKLAHISQQGLPKKGLELLQFEGLMANNLDFPCAYFDSTFKADYLEVSSPVIKVQQNKRENKFSSPQEALFFAIRNVFKKVEIKEISSNDAYVELLGSPQGLQNFSLSLFNFSLDDRSYQRRADKFFSDDIDLSLRNFRTALPDNLHTLKVREVGFSTRNNSFYINNLLVSPRKDGNFLARLSKAEKDKLTKFYCTRIAATGADIWKLYLEKKLQADQLKISGPELDISHYIDLAAHLRVIHENDSLTALISSAIDTLQPIATIDSLVSHDSLTFLPPSDTLPLPIETTIDSILSDTTHFLAEIPEEHRLSPPDSFILAGFEEVPLRPLAMLPFSLPDLSWLGDLLKFRETELKKDPLLAKKITQAIYGSLSSRLSEVTIKHVSMQDGSVNWRDRKVGHTEELLNIKGVELGLDGMQLNASSATDTARILLSKRARLSLDSLRLNLPDSLHRLSLQQLSLSTADSVLRIEMLDLQPMVADFYFIKNQTAKGSQVLQLHLPGMALEGFDIRKLLNSQVLDIRYLDLKAPKVVHFMGSQPQAAYDSTALPLPTPDITSTINREISKTEPSLYPLLRGMVLHELNVQEGAYSLAEIKRLTETVFRADQINICGKYITLDSAELRHDQVKFELLDLEVSAKDYFYYLPDQVHHLKVAELGISVSDSAIYAHNLTIEPRPWLNMSDSSNIYNITIPEARVDYIDLMAIYHQKNATAKRVTFTRPLGNIQLFNNTIIEKKALKKRVKLENLYELIDGTLDTLAIKELTIEEGVLNLVNTRGERVHYVQSDRIELIGKGFFLDKFATLGEKRFLYSDDITLTIGNYSHRFPDQWHSVRLSEMGYSTASNEFYADYVHYAPKNWADASFMDRRKDGRNSYDVYTPRVEASDIGLYGLYMYDSLGVGRVNVREPQLRFVNHWQPSRKKGPPKTFSTDSLYTLLKPVFKDFNIGELSLDDVFMELAVYEPKDSTMIEVKEADLLLQHFEVDEKSSADDPRFLHADNFRVSVKEVAFNLPDSLYTCTVGEVGFATGDSLVFIREIELIPRYGKQDIAEITGVETDWMHIQIENINLKGFDFDGLANQKLVQMGHAVVDGFDVYIYRDKRPPMPLNHYPPMPQEFLRDLGTYLNIDTLSMVNSSAVYEELSVGAKQPGRISFEQMNATAFNITNDTALVAKGASLIIFADAMLMGEGRLDVQFNFNLGSQGNEFNYQGKMGPMNMTLLNEMLEDVAGVKINSGENKSLDMKVKADKDHAEGVMSFRYNDLNVTLIDQETKKAGFLRSITSLFANFLVVKSDNPRFLFLKKGKIYTPRPKNKSIFNYMAKTALSGLKHSVGLSNEKPEKQHKKNVFELWRTWTGQDRKRKNK